ncbi:MAG: hypothetical protein DMG30_15030 [Acidobacteria bacterium]|nr:MAG: hypothetical protein DMG30_15030 [Acidobacteriota bacterium]
MLATFVLTQGIYHNSGDAVKGNGGDSSWLGRGLPAAGSSGSRFAEEGRQSQFRPIHHGLLNETERPGQIRLRGLQIVLRLNQK